MLVANDAWFSQTFSNRIFILLWENEKMLVNIIKFFSEKCLLTSPKGASFCVSSIPHLSCLSYVVAHVRYFHLALLFSK